MKREAIAPSIRTEAAAAAFSLLVYLYAYDLRPLIPLHAATTYVEWVRSATAQVVSP